MSRPDDQGRNGNKSRQRDHPIEETHHVHYPFWFGGSASCFAAAVTHPLDLIKACLQPTLLYLPDPTYSGIVRLQTRAPDGPKGMFGTFVHIVKNDGFFGLYSGLSASILRQLTYSTTRFGVYSELKDRISRTDPHPSLLTLILLSTGSGILGGIAGNPADVLNVRMQNDASLPLSQRRNYRHALHGLYRMVVHEEGGWRNGFRGVGANSMRAGLMTASQLASYDSFKRWLVEKRKWGHEELTTHFAASLWAGFVATTVCSPVDVVKTRIMSASSKGEGIVPLLTGIYQKEGLTWMFRGWLPSFVRLGPHTIATFLILEQHKRLWRQWKGIETGEVAHA